MVVLSSSVNIVRLKDENVELELKCSIRTKSKLWNWTHVLTYILENDAYRWCWCIKPAKYSFMLNFKGGEGEVEGAPGGKLSRFLRMGGCF